MDMDDLPRRPQTEEPKPVAYDADGNPLYAAPPRPADPSYGPQPGPQFVHLSRATDPVAPTISDELKTKHDQSVKDFPSLSISEAEYIVSAIRRHPIGMVLPIVLTVFSVAVVASLLINYPLIMSAMSIVSPLPFGAVLIGGLLVIAAILLSCYVSIWIYSANKFYLTNESVIQEIQSGLFSRQEQTVSLANIEDASFHQSGPLQLLFNYGTIRLSTEGDETTYTFQYAANPKQQIAILNNAVEAFKNGRPVQYED